jgi:hypothetical protein
MARSLLARTGVVGAIEEGEKTATNGRCGFGDAVATVLVATWRR